MQTQNLQTQNMPLGHVSRNVRRQHAELRARLRGLDAGRAAPGSPLAAAHVRISIHRLAAEFEAHLAYEERELAPHIRAVDAWGAEREAAMLREHVAQRTRLEQLCAAADDDELAAIELEGEVSWLVVTLLEDMSREEAELEELARLEAIGLVDQMTG